MLNIDGAIGEGGGQILRTALTLSLCLNKPFRIVNIRRARQQPGLRRQHLVAVQAAAEIGRAEVKGATLGSRELVFIPQGISPGDYHFDIGSAGSTTLVVQTVLPALLSAGKPSQLTLEGGTHNPMAPPFDFLERVYLPLINRMGPKVSARIEHYGFYPAGGGCIQLRVDPAAALQPLYLNERGRVQRLAARAYLSQLPEHIAQRELDVIEAGLGLQRDSLVICRTPAVGPGNALVVEVQCEQVTELFSAVGQRGIRAETVAKRVVDRVKRYLSAGVPVGEYLADQLLLPLALAGGGSFLTMAPSRHTMTNCAVLQQFMAIAIHCEPAADGRCLITVS